LSEFDLRALLEALNGRGVRFIVIGGVAVGAHGYLRATADLDLVPDPDPKNLDQLIDALHQVGGLDIVQRARGVPTFSTLTQDAVDSDVLGVPVKVCSLTRLREMKEAQGRTQDRADLENLPEP
jgi:predicted nucleotidyltransferase